jgi:hypothetical protein
MAVGKVITLAFGLLLVLYLTGVFGPGPLVPGLGPLFRMNPISETKTWAHVQLLTRPPF